MITLISTVYNCINEIKDSVEYFLNEENIDLFDNLIICDGGSTDGTLELLETYKRRYDKIILIEAPGVNISRGRNIAISASKAEIIVAFDSGTTYCKGWLTKMTDPIKNNEFDIVEGNSVLIGNNRFQKIICNIIDDNPKEIKQGASHRCISYRRSIWEKIGGYPENVQAGEDTWFNSMARKLAFRIKYDNTATCFWEVRKDLTSYLIMIYRNTSGHISLKDNIGTFKLLMTSIINCAIILGFIVSIFSVYIFGSVLLFSIAYFAYRLLRAPRYKYFFRPGKFLYGTFIIFMIDLTISRAFLNNFFVKKS